MGLKSGPCLARQAAHAGGEAILCNSRDSAAADQAPAKRCPSGRGQVTYRLVAERKKARQFPKHYVSYVQTCILTKSKDRLLATGVLSLKSRLSKKKKKA